MEVNELLISLRRNAAAIRNLFYKTVPKWKSDTHYWDKVGYGFNKDDRRPACGSIPISFDTWEGVYGDSSCGRVLSLHPDIFHPHFLKYLNDHAEEIMLAVADSIEEEARGLKEKAQAELQGKLKALEEL